MFAARIYSEIWDIHARLRPFGVTRDELIAVAREVVGARADAVENDPIAAAGLFAYIYGTRNLRALLRTKGYLLHRQESIEAVRHPDRPLTIVYQNVDLAADHVHEPRAISGKGAAADRMIDSAQGLLFTDADLAAGYVSKHGIIDTGVWFYCVSVCGDDVRAELSLPLPINGHNFGKFLERIFILQRGEWSGVAARLNRPSDPFDIEPRVTRK